MEKKEWTEESDVGITEYLNPGLKAIKGKIKARYSDFIVNEIDQQGKLCYISKAEVEKKVEPVTAPEKPVEEEKKALALSEEFKEKLKQALKSSKESYSGLLEFIENVTEGIVPKDTIYQFPCSSMDKGDRTAFHQLIKQNCSQFETNTVLGTIKMLRLMKRERN